MKKCAPAPKETARKRLDKSKIMKIASSDIIFLDCKENKAPQNLPFEKQFKAKPHERTIKEFGRSNPYDIPNHKRLFSKSKGQRKVKPKPFIMSDPHTICDIDSTFYKIIEGRPLRRSDDIKVYMRNIRDITLFRANASYLKDQVIQIDTSYVLELKEFNAINEFFKKQQDNFTQFSKDSYITAKNVQDKASEKEKQLDTVVEELESFSFEYVALRYRLGVVMINYEILSKYRQLLNMMSPATWLAENYQEHVSFIVDNDTAEVNTSRISINEYKSSVGKFKNMSAKLFFKKPKQLMVVFKNISQQCLTYMGINVLTSNILSSILKRRDYLKVQMKEEINEMEDLVEAYSEYVNFIEEKAQRVMVKFSHILINEFQTLFCSYDASKLFTCVQYTNTQVFQGTEDPKDNIVSLMLQLERHYIELTSVLDDLNQEVVKEASNEFFSEDLKVMERAHRAQRTMKECDILRKALHTSFEPTRGNCKSNVRGIQ